MCDAISNMTLLFPKGIIVGKEPFMCAQVEYYRLVTIDVYLINLEEQNLYNFLYVNVQRRQMREK